MQPPTLIRKILLNALIADLTALQKEGVAPPAPVFPIVSKYFHGIPPLTPALYLANFSTDNQDNNNLSFDDLRFGFTAYVYESLEASTSESELAARIDRLVDCEGYLYKYTARVPNNIGTVQGVRVVDSIFVQAPYTEIETDQGAAMQLAFRFDLTVNVNVQLIST